MNSLRQFFLTRLPREQSLLLALAFLGAALLGHHVLGRASAAWSGWTAARAEAEAQRFWLAQSDAIAARAEAATRRLQPAQTRNAARLVGELGTLASEAGLVADIGAQQSERAAPLAFHTVQVNFREANLPALVRFYTALAARSPYLSLEQLAVSSDPANPDRLTATLRVGSVELER